MPERNSHNQQLGTELLIVLYITATQGHSRAEVKILYNNNSLASRWAVVGYVKTQNNIAVMRDGVEGRLKRIRKAMTRDDSLEAVVVRRRRTENPHVLRFRLVSHHQFIIESTLNPSSVLSVSQFSLLPSSLGECAVKALV
eukprot:scaffold29820_cov95-Cyclotella_meneghiniana.AAC.6